MNRHHRVASIWNPPSTVSRNVRRVWGVGRRSAVGGRRCEGGCFQFVIFYLLQGQWQYSTLPAARRRYTCNGMYEFYFATFKFVSVVIVFLFGWVIIIFERVTQTVVVGSVKCGNKNVSAYLMDHINGINGIQQQQ